MATKLSVKQAFPILGGSITLLFKNPQILYPFGILAFVQLSFMEVLFFSNRWPLVKIFGPIISRLKGNIYLHYPYNYELIHHWFQSAQVFIFLFFSSLFIGKAVITIACINKGEGVGDKMPVLGLRRYINMMFSFLLIFVMMYGVTSVYGILMRRAVQIQSVSGIYFLIKQAVLVGAPYINLLFSIILTALFAYLIPLVVLEKKNVFIAVGKNFETIWPSFAALLTVIAATSMLYVPILLIRSNQGWFSTFVSPEGWQIFVVFSVFVMLFIDAVQYTAITTCYLLTKDE